MNSRCVLADQAQDVRVVEIEGGRYEVGYEPGESKSAQFGGNSNWRGPVWLPLNILLIERLHRFHEFCGRDLTVECPTGSGRWVALAQVADDLCVRVAGLFLDRGARRPVFGDCELFQSDPAWHDLITRALSP